MKGNLSCCYTDHGVSVKLPNMASFPTYDESWQP